MPRHRLAALALATALAAGATQAMADQVLGGYQAWIGTADLYNSQGDRLSEHWQVLRQDRANYHRFGIWQDGDQWDPFFDDADARARMERLIMNGSTDPAARRAILNGNVMVNVTVWGEGGRLTWIDVEVWR